MFHIIGGRMVKKFKVGELVSSHPLCRHPFMPGVGEVKAIITIFVKTPRYVCEHNGKLYQFEEDEIYEYDPY
jgi:hypothetical protein